MIRASSLWRKCCVAEIDPASAGQGAVAPLYPKDLPQATATQPCGSWVDCRQHDFRHGLLAASRHLLPEIELEEVDDDVRVKEDQA
jgi:hypothetical protein